jgi:hypothetical protein
MPLPSELTPGPDHAAPTSKEPIMARIRKALVAALGLAGTLVAAGVLDDNTEAIVTGIIAAATALGVYAVKNEPAAPRDPNLRA